MKNLSFLTIFLLLNLLVSSCGFYTSSPDCIQEFRIEIPLTISPARDTFAIGDTIWLTSIIPNEIFDSVSGEHVDFSTFDFKIESFLVEMTGEGFHSAENDFDYIQGKGEYHIVNLSSFSVVKVKYADSAFSRDLSIGIITKMPGTYQMAFYNLTKDLRSVDAAGNKCLDNIFIHYNMNNGENNYDLLLNSPNAIPTPESFIQDGGYAFVVKE